MKFKRMRLNIPLYLKRINYTKEVKLNKETLFELQRRHLKSIPFENLDIHFGIEIKLDIDSIYTKIILNKRGGFCYELNGLFYHLLNDIGFDVRMISGRVYRKDNSYTNEYDHLSIIATIENQKYLVDVGFGKFSLEPLEIKFDINLTDDFGQFRFNQYDAHYLRINEIINDNLIPQYIFKTKERNFSEFEFMCRFHQRSKDSHFTKKKVISIVTNNGRITLNDNQLKITKGKLEKETLFKEKEFDSKLKEYFDIVI